MHFLVGPFEVSTHRRIMHSQVRRDLMGQRFKTFKPFNSSTVREASRQASSTALSSEPAEESP
jgi:hypothetical protein